MAELSFPILFVVPPVYSHWSQHHYRHHCVVTYAEDFIVLLPISQRSSLHCCQYRGGVHCDVAKNGELSQRLWQQLSNMFIAPLPTAVRGGAESLKGSHRMGDGRIFLSLPNPPDPSRWTIYLNAHGHHFMNYWVLNLYVFQYVNFKFLSYRHHIGVSVWLSRLTSLWIKSLQPKF